jgi:hypothetical protein
VRCALASQDIQEDAAKNIGVAIGIVFLELFEPAPRLLALIVPPCLVVKCGQAIPRFREGRVQTDGFFEIGEGALLIVRPLMDFT